MLEVNVDGAKDESEALKIARSITNSALVKTAIHGSDPNWGRIISAAGNAGVKFDVAKFDLFIGNFQIMRKGLLCDFNRDEVVLYMRSKMNANYLIDDLLSININLNSGDGKSQSWGCDLSKKYIEINSEYTT